MATLDISVDHIATLRQARGGKQPDPLAAAVLAELAGTSGVTACLHEDRRHLQDRDVYLLKQIVKSQLNLEIAPTSEMIQLACDVMPSMVTLTRQRREERTSEGGLLIAGKEKDFSKIIESLHENNIASCVFVDPDIDQIKAAHRCGVQFIELHTGYFSHAQGEQARIEEIARLERACIAASKYELHIRAGNGLTYENIGEIAALDKIETVIVGHALIARAALVGIETAVRDLMALI